MALMSAEDLLERWRVLDEQGTPPPLDDTDQFFAQAPPEVRAKYIAAVAEFKHVLLRLHDSEKPINESHAPRYIAQGKAERYVHPEWFAAGGMGNLYKAWDVELQRIVAYKVMKPMDQSAADYATTCARFYHEAQITAKLSHPGIVRILGLVDDDADGLPAYAMDYVEAIDLAQALALGKTRGFRTDGGRIDPLAELLRRFIEICKIVGYAHSKGIVHLDIKAKNILIDERFGATWLIDWGIACELDRVSGEVVSSNNVWTPYIFTKNARSENARLLVAPTYASDIFSLGRVLDGILRDCPAASRVRLNPRALAAIVARATHSEREARYASASDLAKDIEGVLDDRPISAYVDPVTTKLRRWAGRHARLLGAACLTLIVLAAILIPVFREVHRHEQVLADDALRFAIATRFDSARLHSEAKNWPAAIASMQELLPMSEHFAARHPGHPEYRYPSVAAYLILGGCQHSALKERVKDVTAGQALESFDRAIEINSEIIKETQFTGNSVSIPTAIPAILAKQGMKDFPNAKWDLAEMYPQALMFRAGLLSDLRRFSEAAIAFEEAIPWADDKLKPTVRLARTFALNGTPEEISKLPWSRGEKADHVKALRLTEYVASAQEFKNLANLYNIACTWSVATTDDKADAVERQRRAERAMFYLQICQRGGYFRPTTGMAALFSPKNTLNELKEDADLAPLRSRPDFAALVELATADAKK